MPASHPNLVRSMRQHLARAAAFATTALLVVSPVAEEPSELYPCRALARLGTVDDSGNVTRPVTPREFAVDMTRACDYAVLGHFVSITDWHYDQPYGSPEPVLSRFQVSEVLHGAAVAVATIRLQRTLLVAPGEDVNRAVSSRESAADGIYRHELAAATERELEEIRGSGQPLTQSQHKRLVDALWRLVEVPTRTRYELHELADRLIWTTSPLDFHSELGAIRPDQVYLLGLSDDNDRPPAGGHVNAVHTHLFWGQEALDIAAALREKQEQ